MNSMTGIFLVCLVGFVAAQRPSYVPNPVRYPDVAPRFRVPTSTEQVALGNRLGVTGPTTTTTTERLPIDARGNVDVVNQIKNWPVEKQPFWYVNAQHIENARGRPQPAVGQPGQQPVQQVNVPSRSSFLS